MTDIKYQLYFSKWNKMPYFVSILVRWSISTFLRLTQYKAHVPHTRIELIYLQRRWKPPTWSFQVGFSGIEYRSLKALDKLSQPLPPSRKKWQSIALVPLCAKNNFPSSYKTCPLETKTGNFLNFLCFDRTTCRSIWWLWCQILFRSCHLRNGNAPSSLEKWSSKKFIELPPFPKVVLVSEASKFHHWVSLPIKTNFSWKIPQRSLSDQVTLKMLWQPLIHLQWVCVSLAW